MYIGKTPTSVPLTSSDITDGIISLPKLTDGTDGNLISYDASGNPVAVATGNDGQVLTSTGAGSPPAFEAAPAGGLSMAQQWRLTANLACNTVNQDTDITANLEAIDTQSPGSIGSGMSVSSGVFTFPSTGIYYIVNNFGMYISSGGSPYSGVLITVSTNASSGSPSFDYATEPYLHTVGQNSHGASDYIVNVTNTSNVKVKLKYHVNGATVLRGHSNHNQTSLTFIKLA